MAQSAKTNLRATATTTKMGLLDTLKSMTNTCNKRIDDVNDCGTFHTELLEAGDDYPAACELERMDRMVARLQAYYLKMRHVWQNDNDDECPLEHLDEIAKNMTNLGVMVKQLAEEAYQYTDFHRHAKQKESMGGKTVDERQRDQTSEENEYENTMYFDAITVDRKRAEERDETSKRHVDTPPEVSESYRGTRAQHPSASKQQQVALSERDRELPETGGEHQPLKKDEHAGGAISKTAETDEYRPRDQPKERGTEIKKTNNPRSCGQTKYYRHTEVVDFTKCTYREWSDNEERGLGMEGLKISETDSDKKPGIGDEPHRCRRVDAISLEHKQRGELCYQFDEEEHLEIALYQCEGDLKQFDERHDGGEIFECDWQKKLRKRLNDNSKEAREHYEKYIAAKISRKEIADETLRNRYSEAMEKIKHASEVLGKEIKKTGTRDRQDRGQQPNSWPNPRNPKNRTESRQHERQTRSDGEYNNDGRNKRKGRTRIHS